MTPEVNRIYVGDCLDILRTWPDRFVQTVVTSPPYWGLRDYGAEGQIGLEETPEAYVQKLTDVFREVRRVLRDDGTLWLNLGDSYFGANWRGSEAMGSKQATNRGVNASQKTLDPKVWSNMDHAILKPKDLIGIPWRVALALQADGWYLRSDIIWSKLNPMPESVIDRPTKAHEYIFLMTKSERYFYDDEAIKEPVAQSTIGRGPVDFGGAKGRRYSPPPSDPNYRNGHEQWGRNFDYRESCANGRNKRSVWTVASLPFSEAHFATFPPDLIKPCVLAGTSDKGCCSACGASWERIIEKEKSFQSGSGQSGHFPIGKYGEGLQGGGDTGDIRMGPVLATKTVGWKAECDCHAAAIPNIVLDPFMGAGTTALVAATYNRHYLGIELNPEYAMIAERRIADEQAQIKMAL